MSKFARFYPSILIILVLFLLIILTFKQLPLTFFQQDEWLSWGHVQALGYEAITKDLNIAQLLFAEGRPLSRLFGTFIFMNFGFNIVFFNFYSIAFHFLNTVLVFFIALRLLKSYLGAFIASSFFALNSVSHQVVTWSAASFGSQPAVFFILISLLSVVFYMEKQRRYFLITSFISALVSLYFKETGIFLFVLLPIFYFIYGKKISILQTVKTYYLFFIAFITFGIFRVSELLSATTPYQTKVYISAGTENLLLTLFLRAALYASTSFSLIFVPYKIATEMAVTLMRSYYSTIPQYINNWDVVAQTVILDVVALLLSISLLIFLSIIYIKFKDEKKVILFSVIFFFLSIAPHIVIEKGYAYMEPRYYHATLIPAGLLLAIYLTSIIKFLKKWKMITKIVILFLFLGYLRFHVSVIRADVASQAVLASERILFMQELNNYLPTLKSNTNVFYFTGDKSWLAEGNMTPFQHGFGYSVLSLYYSSGKIPKELLENGYLFSLGEQGYTSNNRLHFGYFNQFDDLKKAVVENNVPISDVHAFFYKWEEKKLYDISIKTQQKLKEEY